MNSMNVAAIPSRESRAAEQTQVHLIRSSTNHHRILPGQGKCLGGEEGEKALKKFREFAKTFPMPLTADAKKQLRARYIQRYADAGVVLFVFVQFLFVAAVTFLCADMPRTPDQAKNAVDNLSKKAQQSVSANARFGFFCCFDQGFLQDFSFRTVAVAVCARVLL